MINVDDPVLNHLLNGCLVIFLLIAIISVIPWPQKTFLSKIAMFSPLLAILTYIAYEYSMPDNYDIRVDLIFVYPLIIVSSVSCIIRYLVRKFHKG